MQAGNNTEFFIQPLRDTYMDYNTFNDFYHLVAEIDVDVHILCKVLYNAYNQIPPKQLYRKDICNIVDCMKQFISIVDNLYHGQADIPDGPHA